MILMIMFPKEGKTKPKNGMCVSNHPPEVLRSKREEVGKRKSPREAFLLTSHFAYLFILSALLPRARPGERGTTGAGVNPMDIRNLSFIRR